MSCLQQCSLPCPAALAQAYPEPSLKVWKTRGTWALDDRIKTVPTGDGKTQLPGHDTHGSDMYKPRRWLERNPGRNKGRRCLGCLYKNMDFSVSGHPQNRQPHLSWFLKPQSLQGHPSYLQVLTSPSHWGTDQCKGCSSPGGNTQQPLTDWDPASPHQLHHSGKQTCHQGAMEGVFHFILFQYEYVKTLISVIICVVNCASN